MTMKQILITTLLIVLGFSLPVLADNGRSIESLMAIELASSDQNSEEEGEKANLPVSAAKEQHKLKSTGRAALYSLLLPGAGQYYVVGAHFKAKLFFGVEAGMWFTYLGFRKYGSFKEDAAKGWAVIHADANPDNGDDDYWIKMTYYDNRDWNEDDGLGYNQMAYVYDGSEANIFPQTSLYYWNWESYGARQHYRSLRNQSKTAFERADIALGIIIGNHVLSAIEAFFSANRYNRHVEFSDTGFKLKYDLSSNPNNPGVTLKLVKSF